MGYIKHKQINKQRDGLIKFKAKLKKKNERDYTYRRWVTVVNLVYVHTHSQWVELSIHKYQSKINS